MIKLEWSPAFDIGVEEIDSAHRRLFAMVHEIRNALEKQDRGLCRTRVEAFIRAAEKHFTEEEELLARVGYAEAEEHKAYHAALLNKAKRLKDVCNEEMKEGEAEDCYSEVMAFLFDDVVGGDKQFKSYLDHIGLTKPRLWA